MAVSSSSFADIDTARFPPYEDQVGLYLQKRCPARFSLVSHVGQPVHGDGVGRILVGVWSGLRRTCPNHCSRRSYKCSERRGISHRLRVVSLEILLHQLTCKIDQKPLILGCLRILVARFHNYTIRLAGLL